MTDKIIISNEEKMADVQLEILFSGPLSLLDPRETLIYQSQPSSLTQLRPL